MFKNAYRPVMRKMVFALVPLLCYISLDLIYTCREPINSAFSTHEQVVQATVCVCVCVCVLVLCE